MEYKVTKVKGEFPSKYPDSKRYVFEVEGYPHELSAFSKFPMKEGDQLNGEVEVNGQYHNFKFAKKASSGGGGLTDNDRYLIKQASESAYAANIGIQHLTKALRDAGVIKDPSKFVGNTDIPYPDDINPEDVPF